MKAHKILIAQLIILIIVDIAQIILYFSLLSPILQYYAYSYGLGFNIFWNVITIILWGCLAYLVYMYRNQINAIPLIKIIAIIGLLGVIVWKVYSLYAMVSYISMANQVSWGTYSYPNPYTE